MENIRRAEDKDTKKIMELLVQVDMVHHEGRPDLFKGPAAKYTEAQLHEIFHDELRPVFVYTDENDTVLGYAFCIYKQETEDNILTPVKTLYIDDLCVDEAFRGQHIGEKLYRFVVNHAKETGCYNLTLNVWTSNENALKFYEKCGLKPQKIGMETILGTV